MKCSVIDGSHVLGKKWTVPIMQELFFKKKRGFNELSRSLKVSPKILSRRLNELESMGLLVKKQSAKESSYRLTRKGMEFQKIIDNMKEFHIKWAKTVDCKDTPCSECTFFNRS